MKNQKEGFTVWFTGLSGSGKSTLADILAERLRKKGLKVERLDGDVVRQHLTKDLGYSKEDKIKNLERVTFVSKLLTRNGVAVIVSLISPYREKRAYAREEIGNFVEVFVKCPIEVCIERDAKGLYKKAIAGEVENFTGIAYPYEEPLNAEIVIETDKESPKQCVDKIIKELVRMGHLKEH